MCPQWYLQSRIPDRLVLILVKPWLQCLSLLWGIGCSLSRITDNRHHWWDVVAGATLGVFFAIFVVRISCKSFRSRATLEHVVLENGTVGVNGSLSSYTTANKRHQSIKKLLSDSSSVDVNEGRELGDMPPTWTVWMVTKCDCDFFLSFSI